MKDGAILANTGHFNVEINIPALEALAESKRAIRDVRRRVPASATAAASSCSARAG